MANYLLFVFNSVLLGLGLAMDAFSVSLANGFIESKMKKIQDGFYGRDILCIPVCNACYRLVFGS